MNHVTLLGRLTMDVELILTEKTKVAKFNMAVNRRFVKEGEERQADFFNITAFGKTAEFVSKYFSKGQQVAVVGRIQNRNWEDENGQKHYATDIIAEEVYFADSKKTTGDANEITPTQNATMNTTDMELPF